MYSSVANMAWPYCKQTIHDMTSAWFIHRTEHLLFACRKSIILLFVILTLLLLHASLQLRVDAAFTKMLPLQHEYMQTFLKYRDEFGGADRIVVAVIARDGNMFKPEFFEMLRQITDEVFFIHGVDRAQVQSLFTPNVRYTEVVEDGITGGNVIPDDFDYSAGQLARVRENILKAGITGRLVANDFSGAIVSAQLLDIDPATGKPLDYIAVARQLEENIRHKYQRSDVPDGINIHIIGFAKVIGDITEGAVGVALFFVLAFVIIFILVAVYAQSIKVASIPVFCSMAAVIWQLGVQSLLGFGMDPLSILVPFLVFAIGVSHGVQMISVMRVAVYQGMTEEEMAREGFRRLLVPGLIALISDAAGFITILYIKIDIIREMAINASIGVAVIILTNLFLLPLLASYLKLDRDYQFRLNQRAHKMLPLWSKLAQVTRRSHAMVIIIVSGLLFAAGYWKGMEISIGDQQRGVPELRADSRYNHDATEIARRFSIGVDVLAVMAETVPEGCIDYSVMDMIDRFEWYMINTQGVQSVIALPGLVKLIHAGWNEGNPKWRALPRKPEVLTQSVAHVPTSSGLLNSDCTVMPIQIYTVDHQAGTIDHVIDEVQAFIKANPSSNVEFRLASGNIGVMAATNQVVADAQFPILILVYAAIAVLCFMTFRSITATCCIMIPLALVSLLTYALMSVLDIGLKVNTLPVVALGAGIGVDYGIYIYNRLAYFISEGLPLAFAYEMTLATSGIAVLFTAITLTAGVMTWIFSPLKFQADMGILLMFMFIVNMLGALLLLPALASVMLPNKKKI